MSWTPRTTAPTYGTPPYDWNAETQGQCTWYAYWRVQEGGGYTPPCWQTGSGSSGSGAYNNASTWLSHYRDPWEVKSTSYTPVPGDIAVFSTADPAGHVCVIESIVNSSTAMISDYNIRLDESFWYRSWTIGGGIGSTGVLIGYLHYPSSGPTPPTPTEELTISITPSSYNVTMSETEDFKDFTFTITISGIPAGQTVSGGNSFPGLSRIYNSGWSYTDYTVSGVGYRTAVKTQTLRYDREHSYAYTITKHMYFNLSFSTGTVNTDTPMYITVKAKIAYKMAAIISRRRKRGIFHVFRI